MEANPGIFEQAKFADYLGIGAGAHGKQTRDGSISRSSKYRAPGAYQKAAGADGNPIAISASPCRATNRYLNS